jgi:hypothetical protein
MTNYQLPIANELPLHTPLVIGHWSLVIAVAGLEAGK